MTNLQINLDTFGFVQREKCNGVTVKNKCGRDFLYYALTYYLPSKFNQNLINPEQINKQSIFGLSLPAAFAWTMLQFIKMPKFLKKHSLVLSINKVKVSNFIDFIRAMLFSRISYDEAINLIENNISQGRTVGLDIALRFQGLEDHVMFVYGYYAENFYVFDTHKVSILNYEKITDDERYIMKISRDEVRKRWKRFGRVWEVSKL